MLSGETLSNLLYAIATDYPDRVENLVLTTDELEDGERDALLAVARAIDLTPPQRARAIGDVIRELGGHRELVNECYRLAFYADEAAAVMSSNPLFSYFTAHRAGRLLDKWIHYFPIYERHLGPYRDRSPRVLEIGVAHGGSLDMWERYLGSSATLVGVDIDEKAAHLADPRRAILIGDQADREFLAAVVEQHGPFDIVIDDGGHTMEQQITSIEALFPAVTDGGIYLVEDCHTSYWEEFGGGRERPGTFVEWVKRRLDDLYGYHQAEKVSDLWTVNVDAIHCYDSVVVLDKKSRFAPFSEQVGTGDFLFHQRPTSALVGEMLATRDAALAQHDAAVDDQHRISDELADLTAEYADLTAEYKATEAELAATHSDLLQAWEQQKALRRTFSWRITAPLRAVRRRIGSRP